MQVGRKSKLRENLVHMQREQSTSASTLFNDL